MKSFFLNSRPKRIITFNVPYSILKALERRQISNIKSENHIILSDVKFSKVNLNRLRVLSSNS